MHAQILLASRLRSHHFNQLIRPENLRNMKAVESDEIQVEDNAQDEDVVGYHDYEIASYPSDYSLKMIASLWEDEELIIPEFQRNFVWTIKQSSLLIESFLLGLPVPQAFIYVDSKNSSLIIDGQQRIMSIVFFLEGYFGPETKQGKRSVFRLTGLDQKSPYNGKRFEDLTSSDQKKLEKSILRVVNIKQLAPQNDNTSVYHIFERLNTGGTPLRPQEIRNCVFHGEIVERLNKLNQLKAWRNIIGRPSPDKHQRDVEFILRVFAMSVDFKTYEKPMKEFLNKRMNSSKTDADGKLSRFESRFAKIVNFVDQELEEKPFHVRGPINLAALDSILSVLIRRYNSLPHDLNARVNKLLQDDEYRDSIFFNTSDAAVVHRRLEIAGRYLV